MDAMRTRLLVVLALILSWECKLLSAHPIHETIGEARFNRNRAAFEVSLRVAPSDLLKELGGEIDLHSNDPETRRSVDRAIRTWLERDFIVKKADGTSIPVTWVGREFDSKRAYVWLHFSFAIPSQTKQLTVSNGLFLRTEEWTNRLSIELDGKRETLTWDRSRPSSSIRL